MATDRDVSAHRDEQFSHVVLIVGKCRLSLGAHPPSVPRVPRLPGAGRACVWPNRVRPVRTERPVSGGAVVPSSGHRPNAFLRFGAVTALLTCATLALSSSHRASE